jgi:Flp pilus assembly pilin Flp
MRRTIIELLSDTNGVSAVEDGIVLGVFGAMIAAGLSGYGFSLGDICHSIGKFLGLL